VNRQEALSIVVSLSHPSKIPCPGYSLSAFKCITGSKLVSVEGSTCSGCYALKGWYPKRKVIQDTMEKRRLALKHPHWVRAMAFLIDYYKLAYFRWHDSGDIQGVWHLAKISEIAWMCPETKFWLPTREWGMVAEYIDDGNVVPSNLCIRLSAHMVNQSGPLGLSARLGVTVSEVNDQGNYNCLASTRTVIPKNGQHKTIEGYCGACRLCWNPDVPVIVYKKH